MRESALFDVEFGEGDLAEFGRFAHFGGDAADGARASLAGDVQRAAERLVRPGRTDRYSAEHQERCQGRTSCITIII